MDAYFSTSHDRSAQQEVFPAPAFLEALLSGRGLLGVARGVQRADTSAQALIATGQV